MQRMLFHCSQTGEVEEPDYSVVFKLEYTINIVFESLQHKIGVTFHHCGEAIVRCGGKKSLPTCLSSFVEPTWEGLSLLCTPL